MERTVENLLYASRWVLAPVYVALSAGLLLLGVKFFQEVLHTIPLVLLILSLVDMAPHTPNDKLMWYVIIHLTFVLSAIGMAYVDRMNRH